MRVDLKKTNRSGLSTSLKKDIRGKFYPLEILIILIWIETIGIKFIIIVQMITQIDETGFKIIFYEYYDTLYSGFYKKTQSDIVSQDLVQLTFIRFWKYRESFNQEISIEMQLFRKGKQCYIDWLRKEARNREMMDNLRYHQTIPMEELSIDLKDSLIHAINKLPEVRQKVFHLAYIEGYSHKEIASQLGISVRTVDTHIYKALKQLRKILAFIFILIHL